MAIESRPDHVAIAVHDTAAALTRWRDTLSGVVAWRFHNPSLFRGTVLRFAGGAFLEVLEPSDAEERVRSLGGPQGFLERFLDRHGPSVHHVTLKVPDLHGAVATLAERDIDAVDVDTSDPDWHEAFLRPSQIGGFVVQLAATSRTAADQAASQGEELPAAPETGGRLLGPLLHHPDLDRAATVWAALGGDVRDGVDGRDGLLVRWPGSPLSVAVLPGERAGPVGLRFSGAAPRPSDDTLGPAVLAGPGPS